MNFEDENWDALAGMLRREIEGYGRLFGLLEAQRENFLSNDLNGLLSANDHMTEQTTVLHGLKREREALVSGIWAQAGETREPATVKGLIRKSPAESGPLFEELLHEVNRLIDQSRRKLEQNQMLLRRSREIGQRFLDMINPEMAESSGVYSRNGRYGQTMSKAPMSRYQIHA